MSDSGVSGSAGLGTAPSGTEDWVSQEPERRGGRIAVGLVVVVLVIAGLVVAADLAARSIATNAVEVQLRNALSLPSSAPVDVKVGGFSILVQLSQGRLADLDISIPRVAFGDLTGDADVRALGVPFDREGMVDSVDIKFRMNADELKALSANLSGLPVSSVEIADPDIRIVADFEALGVAVPIGVGIEPGTESGQLTFVPTSITIGGATISADELRQVFGAPGVLALRTQSVCIAQNLPASLTVTDVGIDADELVLTLEGSAVPLGGPALEARGTCA